METKVFVQMSIGYLGLSQHPHVVGFPSKRNRGGPRWGVAAPRHLLGQVDPGAHLRSRLFRSTLSF